MSGDEDLHEAVALFVTAAHHLNVALRGRVDNLTWRDSLDLLDGIRAAVREAQAIDASLTRHIYVTGPHGTQEVDGIGAVEITRGSKRTRWDERSALYAVLDTWMEDRGGEIPEPAEVVDKVLEIAGIQYLRVNALRAHRLRPDDYCHTEPGTPRVVLPASDPVP